MRGAGPKGIPLWDERTGWRGKHAITTAHISCHLFYKTIRKPITIVSSTYQFLSPGFRYVVRALITYPTRFSPHSERALSISLTLTLKPENNSENRVSGAASTDMWQHGAVHSASKSRRAPCSSAGEPWRWGGGIMKCVLLFIVLRHTLQARATAWSAGVRFCLFSTES
jgi:hypothetical protein